MKVRAALAVAAIGIAAAAACETSGDLSFPVAAAPASQSGPLRDELVNASRTFAFDAGDWLGDQSDAPAFGVASLARRADLTPEERTRRDQALARGRDLVTRDPLGPDGEEALMAAFGLVVAGEVGAVEAFLDRVDAAMRARGDDLSGFEETYGATVVTGLVALLHAEAALAGSARADAHQARAVELEARLASTSLGDLVDPTSGRGGRGFAPGPGEVGLTLLPNAVMMLVEARLFRLTHDETHRLQARALFAAIQPLARGTRYIEPEAAARLGATTTDVSTLAGSSALALALLATFEVTGDRRYVEEADRVLAGLSALRTPRGLAHHVADGKVPVEVDGGPPAFCAGCNFHALFASGVRRALAGEAF